MSSNEEYMNSDAALAVVEAMDNRPQRQENISEPEEEEEPRKLAFTNLSSGKFLYYEAIFEPRIHWLDFAEKIPRTLLSYDPEFVKSIPLIQLAEILNLARALKIQFDETKLANKLRQDPRIHFLNSDFFIVPRAVRIEGYIFNTRGIPRDKPKYLVYALLNFLELRNEISHTKIKRLIENFCPFMDEEVFELLSKSRKVAERINRPGVKVYNWKRR